MDENNVDENNPSSLAFGSALISYTKQLFKTDPIAALWNETQDHLRGLRLFPHDIVMHAGEFSATVTVRWTVQGSQFNEKMMLYVSPSRQITAIKNSRYIHDVAGGLHDEGIFYFKTRALILAFAASGYSVGIHNIPCKHRSDKDCDDQIVRIVLTRNVQEGLAAWLEFVECGAEEGGR